MSAQEFGLEYSHFPHFVLFSPDAEILSRSELTDSRASL